MTLKDGRAQVRQVITSTPADEAGLRNGDIIVAYDGEPINQPGELQQLVRTSAIGHQAAVTIERDGH